MGQQVAPGETEDAETAAGAVNSHRPGCQPTGPPHRHLRRHRGCTIEAFHQVLKSGCRAEESELRTAPRLTNWLAVLCVVGWRVFWLTMLGRAAPEAAPEAAFTPAEVAVLDRVAGGPPETPERTVSRYLGEVAKLGGYLARAQDPPPGNMVVWRGLARLADILIGAELNKGVVGN
jgi:hypothetical protein